MPLSQDLFDSIDPPGIWVTLGVLIQPEHDDRTLTVRVQERGKRSVTATVHVSRYAPEGSCLTAVAKMMDRLQVLQIPLDRATLADELQKSVNNWVDPF